MDIKKLLSSIINILIVVFYVLLLFLVTLFFIELDIWDTTTITIFSIAVCGIVILFLKFLKKKAEEREKEEN